MRPKREHAKQLTPMPCRSPGTYQTSGLKPMHRPRTSGSSQDGTKDPGDCRAPAPMIVWPGGAEGTARRQAAPPATRPVVVVVVVVVLVLVPVLR